MSTQPQATTMLAAGSISGGGGGGNSGTVDDVEVEVKEHQQLENYRPQGQATDSEVAVSIDPTFHLADKRLALVQEGSVGSVQGVDVLVNFCTPHVLSGVDSLFQDVHDMAGPKLAEACAPYKGMGVGSCCMTDAFNARNFKKIAHCIIPPANKLELGEQLDFALCLRNAMDLAAEWGMRSVLFRHPFLLYDRLIVRIMLLVVKRWLDESPYSKEMERVAILCGTPELHALYAQLAGELEALEMESAASGGAGDAAPRVLNLDAFFPELNELLSNLDGRMVDIHREQVVDLRMVEKLLQAEFESVEATEAVAGSGDGTAAGFGTVVYTDGNGETGCDEGGYEAMENDTPPTDFRCLEQYGFDEEYVRQNAATIYDDMFKTPEGIQLQLSRNLSPTILTIEEEDGTLRQYRMTTQSREGETSYFRCSRCESLMRHTNAEYRPKITVKNGYIFGDCYPVHHPECKPMSKFQVVLQQMDRQARMNLAAIARGAPPNSGAGNEWEDTMLESGGMLVGGGANGMMMHAGSVEHPPNSVALRQMGGADLKSKANDFAALNSAKSRLRMVDETIEGHGTQPTIRPPTTVISSDLSKHLVSGNTLQAIRKCESELSREDGTAYEGGSAGVTVGVVVGMGSLEQEEMDDYMEGGDESMVAMVPGEAGGHQADDVGRAEGGVLNAQPQSALWIQQRAEIQRRHKREQKMDVAVRAGSSSGAADANESGSPGQLNDQQSAGPSGGTRRMTRAAAAAAAAAAAKQQLPDVKPYDIKPQFLEPPSMQQQQSLHGQPQRLRGYSNIYGVRASTAGGAAGAPTLARRLLAPTHHLARHDASMEQLYSDESMLRGGGGGGGMEAHVGGMAELGSGGDDVDEDDGEGGLAGEGGSATGAGKHKKYRIIRVRKRTNVEFGWTNNNNSSNDGGGGSGGGAGGAGGKGAGAGGKGTATRGRK